MRFKYNITPNTIQEPAFTGWLVIFKSVSTLLLLCLISFRLSAQNACAPTPSTDPCFSVSPVVDGDPGEWVNILKSNSSCILGRAFRRDANQSDDDQWVGSKDEQLVGDWRWKNGSTNQKGDLSNAGVVRIGRKIYFFGDRTAVVGDAQIGFWFFLGGIKQTGTGGNGPASGFTGTNEEGDILAISNFINGGGTPQLQLYIRNSSNALVPLGTVVSNVTSCIRVNTETKDAPNTVGDAAWDAFFPNDDWTFAAKSGPAQKYPSPLFFEGVIDFTSATGVDLCFNEFLLETRNSQSLDASLQDFVAGDFTVKPARPVVEITEATVCGTLTSPSLTVKCPITGTYTLKQTGETDRPVQNTGTADIVFTNLKVGKGFSISVDAGGCPSDPTDCDNYTTNSCPPASQSLQTQSIQSGSEGIDTRSGVSQLIQSKTKISAMPNPFNDNIKFSFESDVTGQGTLELYNILGQKIKTVFQGPIQKGQVKTIEYNVPSTSRSNLIYIFRVGNQKLSGKLLGPQQ